MLEYAQRTKQQQAYTFTIQVVEGIKACWEKWYDVIDHQWELDWEGLYFQLFFICDNQGGY